MPRKKAESAALKEEPTSQPTAEMTSEELLPPAESQPAAREPGDEKTYPPEPNPRSWAHDNEAGVQLFTRREPYQAELKFNEKPSAEVIALVKDNGFTWDGREKHWTRPIGFTTQAQDRLVATRAYKGVVDQIRSERGLDAGQERTPF